MSQPEQTTVLLKAHLQSELIGLEGHVDGLLQGALRGWAGRRGQEQPARIWLQAAGQEPWPLICDQGREDLQTMGLQEPSGFHLDPQALPPRADSKSHHGFGDGWRVAIASNAVMSCITACIPARIDRNPASLSRFIAAVRSVAIAPAPLPR